MKKTLLLAVVLTTAVSVLQAGSNRVWNFGGDATTFPVSTGIGTGPFPVIVNDLEITGISTNVNMGAVNASAKTFGGNTYTNRFQMNGAGYPGAAAGQTSPSVSGVDYFVPTQRFLSFNVDGNSSIKIHAITGSSGTERILFVTNGVSLVGSVICGADNAVVEGNISYTGGATKLYIFGNAAINLYYLSATSVVAPSPAGVASTFADKGISIKGNEVLNANNSKIEIYNVLGKKVLASTENVSFEKFEKGMYVVRTEGVKEALKFIR